MLKMLRAVHMIVYLFMLIDWEYFRCTCTDQIIAHDEWWLLGVPSEGYDINRCIGVFKVHVKIFATRKPKSTYRSNIHPTMVIVYG